MKSKAKENGSGGRLRLAILLTSVAAFLLVPAAAASAAALDVDISGSGDGTVITSTDPFYAELQSEPPIDCDYVAPGPQTGVCDAVAANTGPNVARLVAEPAPGSVFKEWVLGAGVTAADGCGENLECGVFRFGGDIAVDAIFEKEPNVHITIEGEGSGSVLDAGATAAEEGTPPVDCHYVAPGPQTGVCDTLNGAFFGGALEGISVKQEAAPGSVFVDWIVEEGTEGGADCFPGEGQCTVFTFGEEIKIKAVFAAIPAFKLNLTTSGSGSGTLKCDSGSGVEACQPEYTEGTVVEVLPSANTGSEFIEWTGDCSGSGVCEVTMDEERSVNAQFGLEKFSFSVNQEGEGTVQCDVNGGGLGVCPSGPGSVSYGDEIDVVATPIGENVIASLTAEGGSCEFEATTGSCEFSITGNSSVSAVFAAGNTIVTQKENVHGEVPQTTELATSCEGDVDLGEFIPGKAESYLGTCGLTVTSTGKAASLTAADETGNDTGYLTQKPTHPYSLPQALESKATGLPGLEYPGEGGGTYAPLTSPVTLLSYGGPVSADNVTLTFRQKIGLHDALHTGVYNKLITLTLKQTTP